MLIDDQGCPVYLEPAKKAALRKGALRHCFRLNSLIRLSLITLIGGFLTGAGSALCSRTTREAVALLVRFAGMGLVGVACIRHINREYASWMRKEIARYKGICPSCGYDLRGQVGARCPECGAPSAPITEGG
jgi:hypothetical protein